MSSTTTTNNIDIDYITKDFSSSVDALISFATTQFGPGTSSNRLWTNFNTDSFSRNWLELVAYVADLFFFYFDQQATQSYLQTATVRSAIKNIAAQFGFTPATATSASGLVTFTFNAAGTVPRGTRVQSSNGLIYYTTTDLVVAAAGNYSATVLQGQLSTETFTSVGLQNEKFNLKSQNIVVDQTNLNAADISPKVTVNGNSYTLVSTFIRSNGTDTAPVFDSLGNVIGGGGRVFLLGERPDGTKFIEFGDGVFGRKLQPNEVVVINYRAGGGSAGNVAKQTVNTLIDTFPFVTSVTNPSAFSGGADEQTIDQLRQLIPASLRTLERAVSNQDYSDILVANFSSVFAAAAEVNTIDPGIDLNVYVVPQGVGIPKISDNPTLKNTLINFIDRRKMVTVQFQILDAFGIDILIGLEVHVSQTASRSAIVSSIQTALLNFFDIKTGGPDGSGTGFAFNVLLKDIDQVIRSVSGIDRFEIKKLTYRPRVDKNIVGLVSDYQTSVVEIFPTVTSAEWLLAASGQKTTSSGNVLFNNPLSVPFTYNSSDGSITYNTFVDLSNVSPGDMFRSGSPGVAEVTSVNIISTSSLDGRYFDIYHLGDKERQTIQLNAGASGYTSGQYFTINSANNVNRYYVWFNIAGGGNNPSPPGLIPVEIDINVTDTAAQIATKVASKLNTFPTDFSASVLSNVVTVNNISYGQTDAAANVNLTTAPTFNVTITGTVSPRPARVWFKSSAAAPSIPSGGRLIEVDYLLSDTTSQVATKLNTVIGADSKFTSMVSGSTVTITDANPGYRPAASTIYPSNFTVTEVTQGAEGGVDFFIFAVDSTSNPNPKVWIEPGIAVVTTPGAGAGGSIRKGTTVYQEFLAFKKINATVTNLSVDSITDNNLDLSVKKGTGVALSARVLLDNNQTFIPNQYATGNYYLVDGANNIWDIASNDSDTITTGPTAVNDAAINTVSAGNYSIVTKLSNGYQVVFNNSLFTVQYNNLNTVFSIGSEFVNIGTIGDSFQISKEQTNKGVIGVPVTIISYDSSTKTVTFDGQPDLQGVNPAQYFLVDSSQQVFRITAVDNRTFPFESYDPVNYQTDVLLTGSGLGSKFGQGFKVSITAQYPIASFYLRKQGNIAGNLTAQIVNNTVVLGQDRPNLSSVVATSQLVNVSTLKEVQPTKIDFSFATPPTLVAGTKYHLVLSGDTGYSSSQIDNVKMYDNSGTPLAYTYSSSTGVIQYSGSPDLSNVAVGNYFKDDFSNTGNYYKILAVDNLLKTVTLAPNLPIVNTLTNTDSGSIFIKNNVYLGARTMSPTYANGLLSEYDGVSTWSTFAISPDTSADAIFSVEGPKSIKINSNLTPVLGNSATISARYYDDNNEISLILGLSTGVINSAPDADARGKGTVNDIPGSKIDHFIFRTSDYNDDIINLRANEIPQITTSDMDITIFGGVA